MKLLYSEISLLAIPLGKNSESRILTVAMLLAGDRLASVVALSLLAVEFNVVATLLLIPLYDAAAGAAATAASEVLALILFTPLVLWRLDLRGHACIRVPRSRRLERHERDVLLDVGEGAPYGGMARVSLTGAGTL